MPRSLVSKSLLATLATLFTAAAILYTAVWMYNSHWQAPVELGFDNQYLEAEHCELVKSVQRGSPAERAGLRAGDRIIAIDKRGLENSRSLLYAWSRHRPGDGVDADG